MWDAIAGMGAERLTPGQAVDSLDEAIDLIRQVWDTDTDAPLRVEGVHHRIAGMRRGPEPAHRIGIHVGAYKPRMLRLVGTKADGWLPSMGYLQIEDLAPANRTIDEAAREAGRDPREIRRALNLMGTALTPRNHGFLQGPPGQWVEELLPLVLEQGISTLVLGTDDPRTIQTLGEEIAPALREAVERERRGAGTPTGEVRPAAVLAARREGVDYDGLPEPLRARSVEPGDRGYERVRHTYMHRGRPGLVLRPRDADQVVEALDYAREQDVELHVRSGGHGISGTSTNDGGIVLDLSALDTVEVLDPGTGRVRLGAGARWGRVATELNGHGLALSSGDHGGVGVGGIATTGGIGYLGRAHGLTIDNITAAEVVTADGRVRRVDATEEPDLFWALRGAGANVGVLLSVEVTAARLGEIVLGQFAYDATDTAGFLRAWGEIAESAPREVTAFLTMGPPGGGRGAVAQAMVVYAGEDTDAAVRALEPFLKVGPVLDQRAQIVPYPAVLVPGEKHHQGHGLPVSRSGLVPHLDDTASKAVSGLLNTGDVQFMQLRQVGGAVNDVPADATAYAHRHQNFSLVAMSPPRLAGRMDDHWARVEPYLEGMYLSFDTRTGPGVLEKAFPAPTLERLRRIKRRYDPEGVFDTNFPVPPAD